LFGTWSNLKRAVYRFFVLSLELLSEFADNASMSTFMPLTRAAELIGVTTGRIRQLIAAEEIHAEKFGTRDWWVLIADAEKMRKNPSKVGRPRSGKK
jgi:hypothetical protein